MQNTGSFSRAEIRTIMITIHRENQALWAKWFSRNANSLERSALYRYREGFDAAILSLAQRLQIDLGLGQGFLREGGKKGKAKLISLEKLTIRENDVGVLCPHCNGALFRKGKRLWHCPACEIDLLSLEEE